MVLLLEQGGNHATTSTSYSHGRRIAALEELYRNTHVIRERTRAQMVLLALEKRLKAAEIAAIVREDDETVRRWLKRWMSEGVGGLRDRQISGSPSKITSAYKERLLACMRLQPRSLGLLYLVWTLRSVDFWWRQRLS